MTTGDASLLGDPVALELLGSRIPARLSYTWTDGTPRVVPIWFHWTGEELVFASFPAAPKAKAIKDGDALAATRRQVPLAAPAGVVGSAERRARDP